MPYLKEKCPNITPLPPRRKKYRLAYERSEPNLRKAPLFEIFHMRNLKRPQLTDIPKLAQWLS